MGGKEVTLFCLQVLSYDASDLPSEESFEVLHSAAAEEAVG